jgi:hypothetical protein
MFRDPMAMSIYTCSAQANFVFQPSACVVRESSTQLLAYRIKEGTSTSVERRDAMAGVGFLQLIA